MERVFRDPNPFSGDASFLLTVEVFLLTVRLFYLRWGNRRQKKTKPNFENGAPQFTTMSYDAQECFASMCKHGQQRFAKTFLKFCWNWSCYVFTSLLWLWHLTRNSLNKSFAASFGHSVELRLIFAKDVPKVSHLKDHPPKQRHSLCKQVRNNLYRCSPLFPLQKSPGLVRLWFVQGTVRAILVSVQTGPPGRGFLCVSWKFNKGGSGSSFGSWKGWVFLLMVKFLHTFGLCCLR